MKNVPETKPVSQASTPNNVQNTTSTSAPSQPTQASTSREPSNLNVPPQNMSYFNLNNGMIDPNQYAMQLAWMQQAYFQYMAQYMQL